ncbi:MAG: hypothetical protein VKK80_05120, partial [Prochlorothrix sp.]|nr:hypothetical protein [Prochlorothrix sp.]
MARLFPQLVPAACSRSLFPQLVPAAYSQTDLQAAPPDRLGAVLQFAPNRAGYGASYGVVVYWLTK